MDDVIYEQPLTYQTPLFVALKITCHFGVKNCWFNHNENESMNENGSKENSNDMNQEVIGKLFEMMEKFTHRIVQIENVI